MSMELTPDDLREIADQVEAASKVSFQVESIKAAGHKVMLKMVTAPPTDAPAGAYKIVDITKGDWPGSARRG